MEMGLGLRLPESPGYVLALEAKKLRPQLRLPVPQWLPLNPLRPPLKIFALMVCIPNPLGAFSEWEGEFIPDVG